MKAKCQQMLDETKRRAFNQINYALHALAKCGRNGDKFTWCDDEHKRHDTVAHYCWYIAFQLGDFNGETDIPLFFNTSTHRWDNVINLQPNDLALCADAFIGFLPGKNK